MTYQAIIHAPFGALGVICDDDRIQEIRFLPRGVPSVTPVNPLAERVAGQLRAWLDAPTQPFDLPVEPVGTPFQRRVWQEISLIPLGQVSTYGDMAIRLDSAARAVGQACRANPLPIVIPCHRVVARQALGGFAGERAGFLIETKQWLLQHEAAHSLR